MLEAWNLIHKYTYIVSGNIPFSTMTLLIFLMTAFFLQNSIYFFFFFFGKNSTFTQSNSMRAVLEIFMYRPCVRNIASRWLQIDHNWKKDNDFTICQQDVVVNFFDVAVFPLSSLVTGPNFMSISWLVLELRQFLFMKVWQEIWKYRCLHFGQYAS